MKTRKRLKKELQKQIINFLDGKDSINKELFQNSLINLRKLDDVLRSYPDKNRVILYFADEKTKIITEYNITEFARKVYIKRFKVLNLINNNYINPKELPNLDDRVIEFNNNFDVKIEYLETSRFNSLNKIFAQHLVEDRYKIEKIFFEYLY